MPVLDQLLAALASAAVEIIDLTAPLESSTPVIRLPEPCKYGLTQLQNLGALPPTGAVVVAGPLPITGGSGSPARVLALVERP